MNRGGASGGVSSSTTTNVDGTFVEASQFKVGATWGGLAAELLPGAEEWAARSGASALLRIKVSGSSGTSAATTTTVNAGTNDTDDADDEGRKNTRPEMPSTKVFVGSAARLDAMKRLLAKTSGDASASTSLQKTLTSTEADVETGTETEA